MFKVNRIFLLEIPFGAMFYSPIKLFDSQLAFKGKKWSNKQRTFKALSQNDDLNLCGVPRSWLKKTP